MILQDGDHEGTEEDCDLSVERFIRTSSRFGKSATKMDSYKLPVFFEKSKRFNDMEIHVLGKVINETERKTI